MITITAGTNSHVVTSTIFPDGTSQVWKLPEWALLRDETMTCRWDFENEREIIDLISLNQLVYFDNLVIPYLPYARQDKYSDNNQTFNLGVFGLLLRTVKAYKITSYDVHSGRAKALVLDLYAMDVIGFHIDTLLKMK